mgnify:CR=1 FL=1
MIFRKPSRQKNPGAGTRIQHPDIDFFCFSRKCAERNFLWLKTRMTEGRWDKKSAIRASGSRICQFLAKKRATMLIFIWIISK